MSEAIAQRTSVLILSLNEAPNLVRCLDRLEWAPRIVLVDSGSTDETLEIAGRYANVSVVHRPFDSFARQCNYGLDLIETDWVLSLDADYELSADLVREIQSLREETVRAYAAAFVYRIYGKPLRGTLYPPRTVLYRRQGARYRDEGHGHRVAIAGEVGTLAAPIYHDDRKPLLRWVDSQRRYAHVEADHLLATPKEALSRVDRLRLKAWPAPLLVFFYTLLWKGAFLDGWAGWYYTLQRTIAEGLIALNLIDRRMTK